MKKLTSWILIVIVIFPLIVFAGGDEDDTTYTTAYAEGYIYGDVKKCATSSGVIYFEGIKTVSGHKACLWNTETKVGTDTFKCEDSSMERFTLGKVVGSDGYNYYGYGCRKVSDDAKIEYTTIKMQIGDSTSLGNQNYLTCSILSGTSVETHKNNSCYISAVSEGETTIKTIYNKGLDATQAATYYKIVVSKRLSSQKELDSNYLYGNVKKCVLDVGGTVNFDGLTFCGSSAPGFTYNDLSDKISCENGEYETFKLKFVSSNGYAYTGYGCRKPKSEEVINYVQRELYVGYGSQVASQYSNECNIIEGDAGEFNKMNSCWLDAKKPGKVKVVVKNKNTSKKTYYEFTIKSATTSLDDNYYYTDVSKCSIRDGAYSSGYEIGNTVVFNGYKFCGSTLQGFNFDAKDTNITCSKSKYKLFTLTFSANGNTYKGYGCRCSKNEDCSDDSDFEMPDISLTPDSLDCVGILGRPDDDISKPPAFYLQTAFTVMKYVAIVILIVFTIMDYASAVAAQDNDAIKKATSKLVTRLIICVILFVLPTIIEFLFKILDIYGDAAHCKIN